MGNKPDLARSTQFLKALQRDPRGRGPSEDEVANGDA
jgi:hypothetical protein